MTFAKRALGLILALAFVLTMAGCSSGGLGSDTSYVAKSGNRTVSSALYMRFLLDAYTLADSVNQDSGKALMDSTIEDKPAAQWIQDTARDDVSRYFACMDKFDQLGLSYTDSDQAEVDNVAAQTQQKYADLFKNTGIGLDSLKLYYEYNVKAMALFNYYYDKGGEKEVSDDEIKEAMRKDYNLTKVMIFDKAQPTTDSSGKTVEPTAQAVADAKAKATAYYDRAKAGEDFEKLFVEWKTSTFGESDSSQETSADHSIVTQIGGSDVPAAYAKVMDSAAYNEPQFIEDDSVYYVAIRMDIGADEQSFNNYRSTVLLKMRSEDYRKMVDEWIKVTQIAYNEPAFKKYTAETVDKAFKDLSESGTTSDAADVAGQAEEQPLEDQPTESTSK